MDCSRFLRFKTFKMFHISPERPQPHCFVWVVMATTVQSRYYQESRGFYQVEACGSPEEPLPTYFFPGSARRQASERFHPEKLDPWEGDCEMAVGQDAS